MILEISIVNHLLVDVVLASQRWSDVNIEDIPNEWFS
jgi:hypothetical protein